MYSLVAGGSDERLEEVLWELLFDSDYIVFECCSQAICAVSIVFLMFNIVPGCTTA